MLQACGVAGTTATILRGSSPFRAYMSSLLACKLHPQLQCIHAPLRRTTVTTSASKFDNPLPKRKKGQYIKPKKAPTPSESSSLEGMRLAKALAQAGVASRRASEELIRKRLVKVNGRCIDDVATFIDPFADKVEVEGSKVDVRPQKMYYFAVHKPVGWICSNVDPKFGKRAVDLLQPWVDTWQRDHRGALPPRLFTVGRLDVASQGLIFVTNDGEWANSIQHPRHNITKEYVVRVDREPSRRQLQGVMRGALVDGGHVAPLEVAHLKGGRGANTQMRLVLSEGRNREVRVLLASVGLDVEVLKRTRIGGFRLPTTLKPGDYMRLQPGDLRRVTDEAAQEAAMEAARGQVPM